MFLSGFEAVVEFAVDMSVAHTTLVRFLGSLNHLTRTHNLCTLLLNTAIRNTTNVSNPLHAPLDLHLNPSIFTSNHVRPALGPTIPYYVDLHLLCSTLPQGKADAEIMYNRSEERQRGKKAGSVSVVEVVTDRFGERGGRWTAFS